MTPLRPREFFVVTRNPRSNTLVPVMHKGGYGLRTWDSLDAARKYCKDLPTIQAWGGRIFDCDGIDPPEEV